eukprot:11776756-Alexandrium_andersonii.AAC.1
MATLRVRKFRRAPYGSGRFWPALKEALEAILGAASFDHPRSQRFGPGIAGGHGLPERAITNIGTIEHDFEAHIIEEYSYLNERTLNLPTDRQKSLISRRTTRPSA